MSETQRFSKRGRNTKGTKEKWRATTVHGVTEEEQELASLEKAGKLKLPEPEKDSSVAKKNDEQRKQDRREREAEIDL